MRGDVFKSVNNGANERELKAQTSPKSVFVVSLQFGHDQSCKVW